ncbi:MAG: CHAT domain-containing protein, partial [Nitrospirales bacterium]|nr:CHAT domain-containing protein [Nitrospirales bacterium]
INQQEYASKIFATLPKDVEKGRNAFLQGCHGLDPRTSETANRATQEHQLLDLGRHLRPFCLPDNARQALASLLQGCPTGTMVEVGFEADDPDLLGLPFEVLRLDNDQLLATHPSVVILRRLRGMAEHTSPPLPGPLKILVAVGAPDEGQSSGAVLDQERELQNILDATDQAQRQENLQVRILEVGHPDVIATGIERDAYHILHLSCHGFPGQIELEDEEGRAVPTTAEDLLNPIRATGRPLPMVFLSACHGGVEAGETVSFAMDLLRGGVPYVLAMQNSVSDYYATQLARSFYEHLSRRELLLPSRALAQARKELERTRVHAIQKGAPQSETQPEYATATLFVGTTQESPLADFGLDKDPLKERPVYATTSQVPQLRIDDLIGRRKELRETLRTLRQDQSRAGVILTGIGGVGKSAVAGRAMQRLQESGYLIVTHVGVWNLQSLCLSISLALKIHKRENLDQVAEFLIRTDIEDQMRLQLIHTVLAQIPLVLVFDDFEQNLKVGGVKFRDESVAEYFYQLLHHAKQGRILVTCRYPIPETQHLLRHIPIGPLSLAEGRKLVRRLPALGHRPTSELSMVLSSIGGHPRMMEFLDGLLQGGQGRLPHVTRKLHQLMDKAGVNLDDHTTGEVRERLKDTIRLGTRDVLLEELLEISRVEHLEQVLLQAAVSNLPVSPSGIAHMLQEHPVEDITAVEQALRRLEVLSLIFRFEDGTAWVHRWTAEGLAQLTSQEEYRGRANRAGHYRWWRAQQQSHDLQDAIEAVRNYLAAKTFDRATDVAMTCFEVFRRSHQSSNIALLGGEILETLPIDHPNYAFVADQEAQAYLTLGFTSLAFERYHTLTKVHEFRAQAEPDRADYQRDLSVSYNKMGDLYGALGEGEKAREACGKALAIRERLVQAEPDRADYQRDLSVSYEKMGDLYGALGEGEKAREACGKALAIRERLVQAEPDRADYQIDLVTSLVKFGAQEEEMNKDLLI